MSLNRVDWHSVPPRVVRGCGLSPSPLPGRQFSVLLPSPATLSAAPSPCLLLGRLSNAGSPIRSSAFLPNSHLQLLPSRLYHHHNPITQTPFNVRLPSNQVLSLLCLPTRRRLLIVVEVFAPHSYQTKATSAIWEFVHTMLNRP